MHRDFFKNHKKFNQLTWLVKKTSIFDYDDLWPGAVLTFDLVCCCPLGARWVWRWNRRSYWPVIMASPHAASCKPLTSWGNRYSKEHLDTHHHHSFMSQNTQRHTHTNMYAYIHRHMTKYIRHTKQHLLTNNNSVTYVRTLYTKWKHASSHTHKRSKYFIISHVVYWHFWQHSLNKSCLQCAYRYLESFKPTVNVICDVGILFPQKRYKKGPLFNKNFDFLFYVILFFLWNGASCLHLHVNEGLLSFGSHF